MSKKMTPCEKLGYKVGDRFEITGGKYLGWDFGSIVELVRDDGSTCPEFAGISHKNAMYKDNKMFLYVTGDKGIHVTKISKLKPAKQALADAIHQSGGWLIAGDYNLVTSNHRGVVKFFHEKPRRDGVDWVGGSCSLAWVDLHQQLPNWHQCILSRDEYFTAYPEHVKVEVNNETERKVESEMKSESEVTIKVSEWHKKGELPPVGEVVEMSSVYWDKDRFEVVTILAKTCEYAIVEYKNSEQPCNVKDVSFRPLRTERDKAIDEMINVGGLRARDGAREVFGRLYDAGMYKEAKL